MTSEETLELLDRSRKFIDYVKTNLEFYDIKLNLRDTRWVGEDDQAVAGWFSPEAGELEIAIGKPISEWLPVLVHEFCHFIQWAYHRKDVWDAAYLPGGEDPMMILEEWLAGADFSQKIINKSVKLIVELELDCEKRAYEMLEHMDAPGINLEEFIQKARAHVHFYFEVAKRREWGLPDRSPSRIDSIWRAFPTDWETPMTEFPSYDKCFLLQEEDNVRREVGQLEEDFSIQMQKLQNHNRNRNGEGIGASPQVSKV